jgi:hypothetical protein
MAVLASAGEKDVGVIADGLVKCRLAQGLAHARIRGLHLPGHNLAGRCPDGVFEHRLCKEKEKRLHEACDQGEKRHRNQGELDRRRALFVLEERSETIAASVCDFHFGPGASLTA